MTLTEFLLARIEEDEVVARAVHRHEGDHEGNTVGLWYAEERGSAMVATSSYRVLAECETKRRLVDLVTRQAVGGVPEEDVLRAVALPYADHPDYDPAWEGSARNDEAPGR